MFVGQVKLNGKWSKNTSTIMSKLQNKTEDELTENGA
jgi:hypothetical protein